MIFEFKQRNNITRLRIKKLSPNNYLYGTKKIYAKVSNGILLVRVGGGFMDIDRFHAQYGEQELLRQIREDTKKDDNNNSQENSEKSSPSMSMRNRKSSKNVTGAKKNKSTFAASSTIDKSNPDIDENIDKSNNDLSDNIGGGNG